MNDSLGLNINESFHQLDLTLFQHSHSPYSHIVRAFLDYENIRYKIVEADSYDPSRTLKKEEGIEESLKIPVLVARGEQVENRRKVVSSCGMIILFLFEKDASSLKLKKPSDEEVAMIEKFHKLMPIIGLNRHLTLKDSYSCFEFMKEMNTSFGFLRDFFLRVVSPYAMYLIWSTNKDKVLQKYDNSYRREPFQVLLTELDKWSAVRKEKGQFFGGSQMGIVDIYFFGLFQTMKGQNLFNSIFESREDWKDWYDQVAIHIPHKYNKNQI